MGLRPPHSQPSKSSGVQRLYFRCSPVVWSYAMKGDLPEELARGPSDLLA